MVVAQVLAGLEQEAAGAAGRIADDVLRRRRGHLHHEVDNVARCAELPVCPGAGDLREHVFVEVALGVAVLHRDLGQEVDHLGEQRRRRNGEARALHVRGVRRAFLAHGAQEREHVLGNDIEHRRRILILQQRPAHVGIGDAVTLAETVLALREYASLDRLAGAVGLVLGQRLRVVEAAHE